MDKVILNESFEKLEISGSKELEVIVNKNTSSSLYLYIKDKASLKCKIKLEQNAHLNFLSWNESEEFNVDCEVSCAKNAHVSLNFGELSEGSVKANYKVHLEEEGSSLNLRSATTVETSKHFDIECKHLAPHTESNMENYAVVYEKADYKMVDTGTIVKGAYGSSSHQASRALVLSPNQKCEITPVLLIDENDVQASHATTMGQIDENQLYYLQTRGLTKTQALGLITVGYLMPIASSLKNEELDAELTQKIEKKVGLA